MDGSPIRIREGHPRDDLACLDVIRCAFATVADELGFRSDTHPAFPAYWAPDRFAAARARDGLLLVAEREHTILGCCFAGASRQDPGSWHLKRLSGLPQARHQGVGASLVDAAARRTAAAGGRSLRLQIVASNQRLAAWYLTLGFRLVSTHTPPTRPFAVADFERPVAPR